MSAMSGLPVIVEPSAIDMTLASVLAGGTTGLLSPISFCHWQPDETTTVGRTIWSTIFSAAQVAIAVYSAIKQEEIAEKQLDLAEHWYSHADYKWTRFRDNYMPFEKRMLNEVANKAVPKLNCRDAEHRAQQSTFSSYNIMNKFFRQQSKKYRVCIDNTMITDLNVNRALMLVDSRNFNYADDRWYRDFKDDQRWSRRSNMLNLGRNLDSMALSYGSIANTVFGAAGVQYQRFGQAASQAMGFFGARNDTYMPHSYLGTAGKGEGGLVNVTETPGNIASTKIASTGMGSEP